jgi:hypothetical protein
MVRMSTSLRTSIDVDAAASRDWRVRTDLAEYPGRNPFTISDRPGGGVPLDQDEEFRGLLAPRWRAR